jgi:hypothetical protein
MLKSIKRNLLILTIFSAISPLALAQQVNTLYFMDNVPFRHSLNPAFQPIQDMYVGLPVIGFTQMSIGNNSVALKDVIYKYNGQTVSFLHPDGGNVDKFYQNIHSTGLISTSFETNLLSFGFRHKTAFWSFTLTEKFQSLIAIPRDAFNLALYGTPLLFDNKFNLTKLETDESLYTEAALGYAKVLNKKWSVGAKLKYLFGSANFSNTNTMIKMNAGIDQWTLIGEGNAYYSSSVAVSIAPDFKSMTYSLPANTTDWLKRSGAGAGFDIGATYNSTPNLTFSAALLDVGFIHWKKNALKVNYKTDYTFDGIEGIDLSSSNLNMSGNSLSDSIVAALDSASTYGSTNTSYSTLTPAILNVGAEYTFLDKKMSVGLLSRSQFFKNIISEEITLSVNARPSDRLNASLSTSFFEGRLRSLGAGVGLRTGFIHWTLSADYIPFQRATYQGIPIPYNTKTFNLALGINLVFDKIVPTFGLHKKVDNKGCNCF